MNEWRKDSRERERETTLNDCLYVIVSSPPAGKWLESSIFFFFVLWGICVHVDDHHKDHDHYCWGLKRHFRHFQMHYRVWQVNFDCLLLLFHYESWVVTVVSMMECWFFSDVFYCCYWCVISLVFECCFVRLSWFPLVTSTCSLLFVWVSGWLVKGLLLLLLLLASLCVDV